MFKLSGTVFLIIIFVKSSLEHIGPLIMWCQRNWYYSIIDSDPSSDICLYKYEQKIITILEK